MGEGKGDTENSRRRQRRRSTNEDDDDRGGVGGAGHCRRSGHSSPDNRNNGNEVTATAMTRLHVCDALTEEKERPSNLSRMHATIK